MSVTADRRTRGEGPRPWGKWSYTQDANSCCRCWCCCCQGRRTNQSVFPFLDFLHCRYMHRHLILNSLKHPTFLKTKRFDYIAMIRIKWCVKCLIYRQQMLNLVIIFRPTQVYWEYLTVHDLIYRVNKFFYFIITVFLQSKQVLWGVRCHEMRWIIAISLEKEKRDRKRDRDSPSVVWLQSHTLITNIIPFILFSISSYQFFFFFFLTFYSLPICHSSSYLIRRTNH